ncbi:MAG: M48 family metallopeptidase [Gammaproteobacteria bacterium]|nr:M48 family metallopeptidase [Gammaproteobacteria bacterium]
MHTFTLIFLGLLVATLATQLWLARRHIRHVRAHRDSVPPAFAQRVPLAAHRKAADYTVARASLGQWQDVFGALLLLAWTLGGGLAVLDQSWRGTITSGWLAGTLFLLSVLLISGVLELPLSAYRTFSIEHRFGFNRMTFGLFIGDLIKKTLLSLAFGIPLILAALWFMQSAGNLWWLYLWLLWMGFSLFMVWAYPTLIAPLFNKFKPLERDSLRQRLQALLERTGFRSEGIYVVDSSRRTSHGNAYFTGFGRAKRVVFFDNLLEQLAEPEIEAVVAHELGHFKLHHIVKRIVLLAVLSLAGLAVLGWLTNQPWFYQALGVQQPSNHAALALFMMVSPIFTFFLSPLFARGSRRHEYEADTFAAKQSDANELISALVKLYRENATTLTPDPLYSVFYDSHPPATARIAHLMNQT